MKRVLFSLIIVFFTWLAYGSQAFAIPDFREVRQQVSENPNDLRSRFLLGQYLFRMGNYDGALREWKFIVARRPRAWEVYNRIGVAYFRKGEVADLHQALKVWRFVHRRNPSDRFSRNAYRRVHPIYIRRRDSERPTTEPTKPSPTPTSPPSDDPPEWTRERARSAFDEAFVLYANGSFKKALNLFEQVAESPFMPRDSRYYIAMCNLRQADDPEKAIEYFQHYIDEFGEDARSLSGMGAAYGLLGDFKSQIDCYEGSLKFDPDNPDTHFQLALAYDKLDMPNKTVEHAQRAVQIEASYKQRLQPLIKNSRVAERIGAIITDVLHETEHSQLSDDQIDEYARRVGEILGEESMNSGVSDDRLADRVRGMMRDPSNRQAVTRFMRSDRSERDIERLTAETGVDRSEAEAVMQRYQDRSRRRTR